MFKKILLLSLTILLISCKSIKVNDVESSIDFSINLNDRSNDTFKVSINVSNLSKENSIFQFASTAPGTYIVMDIGRFVSNFEAFDNLNNKIAVEKISVNQYQISQPEKLTKITYEVAETFDTQIKENPIYLMCGTSIENDHVLINGQAVFGYFKGKQANPIRVKIDYPDYWNIGTALKTDKKGRYLANSYDHIVDSPILVGELSKASSKVGNTQINVFTFSKNKVVNSNEILSSMKEMLIAADKFIYGLPVENYTFLYHFDDIDAGAWEHSYSSEYVFKEDKWEKIQKSVKETAAHEFFHIITPLNIHSEIIEQFNFVKPVPSKHLWLYEATTEWASNSMLFKANQISLADYFDLLHQKAVINDYFDENYSLEKLSLTSYTKEGNKQYGNIYNKGALTMGLLDIKLLELSNGKKGLRELTYELMQKYGQSKPFDEANFYDVIVGMTYPEVKDFFSKYIIGSEPLPYKEIYAKIGVLYEEEFLDPIKGQIGLNIDLLESGFNILKCSKEATEIGFKEGDIIKSVNGQIVNEEKTANIFNMLGSIKSGESYSISLLRQGKTIEIKSVMLPKKSKHIFKIDPNSDSSAKSLFEVWSKNNLN